MWVTIMTGARSYGFLVIFVPGSDIYALQPIKFDDLTIWKKKSQLCNRNMEREDIETCQIYLKLILRNNLSNVSRSLVCQPAPQSAL